MTFQACSQGEPITAPSDPPPQQPRAAESADSADPVPVDDDLCYATPLDPHPPQTESSVADLGGIIATFAELVAVVRVTDGLIDPDVLRAVIVRLAYLLGETLPPDL